MSYEQIIDNVIAVEGDEYTNDPNDSGGPTKYGITLDTLTIYRQRPCTADDVQALTKPEAWNCYKWLYVLKPGLDKLAAISPAIGEEVIDTAVNCGVGVAVTILQRCLNAFNKRGTLYPDIETDGTCGPATIRSLSAFLSQRGAAGVTVLYKALNALQGERYIDLAERRPRDEDYTFGWFAARVGLTTP